MIPMSANSAVLTSNVAALRAKSTKRSAQQAAKQDVYKRQGYADAYKVHRAWWQRYCSRYHCFSSTLSGNETTDLSQNRCHQARFTL